MCNPVIEIGPSFSKVSLIFFKLRLVVIHKVSLINHIVCNAVLPDDDASKSVTNAACYAPICFTDLENGLRSYFGLVWVHFVSDK